MVPNRSPKRPTRKVSAGATGGAASVVIVWLVETVAHHPVPGTVAAAVGVLASAAIAYIVPEASP